MILQMKTKIKQGMKVLQRIIFQKMRKLKIILKMYKRELRNLNMSFMKKEELKKRLKELKKKLLIGLKKFFKKTKS